MRYRQYRTRAERLSRTGLYITAASVKPSEGRSNTQVHPQITTNSVFYTSSVIVLTPFSLGKNGNPVLQGYTDRPEQNKPTTNIYK